MEPFGYFPEQRKGNQSTPGNPFLQVFLGPGIPGTVPPPLEKLFNLRSAPVRSRAS